MMNSGLWHDGLLWRKSINAPDNAIGSPSRHHTDRQCLRSGDPSVPRIASRDLCLDIAKADQDQDCDGDGDVQSCQSLFDNEVGYHRDETACEYVSVLQGVMRKGTPTDEVGHAHDESLEKRKALVRSFEAELEVHDELQWSARLSLAGMVS